MSVIELVTAKLTFEGHFAYVWSAWVIGVLLLSAMVLSSWLKRRKLLKQIDFNALIDGQQRNKLQPADAKSTELDPDQPNQIHLREEQK